MNPLNEYLESQFPRMRKFIDEIADKAIISGENAKKTGTMSKMFSKLGKKKVSVNFSEIHAIDTELEFTSLTRLVRKQIDKMQQVSIPGDQIESLKSALEQMSIAKTEKEKITSEES
eukprot:NODE_536_length_7014_cov_0.311208.p6 type:complete len:117 gc:universal NODE_536_length_7014_cov_0.311208:4961-5311(+)